MFCVGQGRQSSASKSKGKKDWQFWLSVSAEDESTLFFCFPWAVVHRTTGSLPFSDEPKEYYGLRETEHEYYECEDENADIVDETEKKSKYTVAPLLMKGFQVDWSTRSLQDAESVLRCIKGLMDDVRFFHAAFSADDVETLYNAEKN